MAYLKTDVQRSVKFSYEERDCKLNFSLIEDEGMQEFKSFKVILEQALKDVTEALKVKNI